VTLTPESRVVGRVWLAGGNVTVAGRVARGLRVAAGSVSVSGAVDGDIEITAGAVHILPTARVNGNLTYTSANPATIAAGAQIQGQVFHKPSELAARAERGARTFLVVARLVVFGGLVIFGIVLLLLVPGFMVSAAQRIRSDFWRSLGLGLLVLIVTPVVAVMVLATVIGIPLGLALVALYPLTLIVGYLTAAVFLGELAGRLIAGRSELTLGRRVALLVGALFVLALVCQLPIAGWIVIWLAVLIGVGAASQEVFRRWAAARS
jgi:hypothetical protein